MKTPSTTLTIQTPSGGTRCVFTWSPVHRLTFIPSTATDFPERHHVLLIINVTHLRSPVMFFPPVCDVLQNTFVGLTNLGATCYVNTFLQVWFHNLELRRSIYQCHNSRAEAHDTESGTNPAQSPIVLLFYLFKKKVSLFACQLW